MTTVLTVQDLVIGYQTPRGSVRALDGATLTVEAGESVGIVGESGSGKSTLALATGRLLPATAIRSEGDVLLSGRSVFSYGQNELREMRRRKLGFIFQDPMTSMDPTCRIGRQMRWIIGTADWNDKARTLLSRAGLRDADRVLHSYPFQLSGGMAQRVAIAFALAGDPSLIIADEPTASLDSTSRDQILELLFSLPKLTGAALMFLSHDLRSVKAYCDRVAVMYGGRVVEISETSALFTRAGHPYTVALQAALANSDDPSSSPRAIPGVPPTLHARSEQCAFAPRCEWAVERCWLTRPELRHLGGHDVVCHRAEELLAVPIQDGSHRDE